MASKSFGTLPEKASKSIDPFTIDLPDSEIKGMVDLLRLTPIASENYENSLPSEDRHLGVRRKWLIEAKKHWETKFDWKKHESYLNTFPQFKAKIHDKLGDFSIHFAALFSQRKDAIPILLLHGWPGSFMEFIPMLDILRKRYNPETLPYHFIIPSLPGFTLSSPQPVDQDINQTDAARIMDSLARELGFGDQNLVQGGDVGSRVARCMGVLFEGCKGVHLNFCGVSDPAPETTKGTLSDIEQAGLKRWEQWKATGTAYAIEHATRPSTIGFVLSSNPLALLAWIGEKFMDWTDEDPSIDTILESVTLYWLTGCAHTNLWSYRHSYGPKALPHDHPDWYIKKPMGYSYFPKELIPIPVAWAATTGNLVWSKIHESGGHFAAMEKPEELLADVEEWAGLVWKQSRGF